jgi:hypothetical protein
MIDAGNTVDSGDIPNRKTVGHSLQEPGLR